MKAITKSLALSISAALVLVLLTAAQARAQRTAQVRAIRPASVSGDLLDILNANDGRLDTRAYSDGPDYKGLGVTIDIGSEQNVIGVSQDLGNWPTHYPGAYKVEVAAL